MNPNGSVPTTGVLAEAAMAALQEGITQVLSNWVALRMAMENGWGGGDSLLNATNLGHRILSWFISAGQNGELFVDDVENHLGESMVSLFQTEEWRRWRWCSRPSTTKLHHEFLDDNQ